MADSSLLRRAVVAAMSLLAAGCVLAIAAAVTDAGDVEFRLAPGWSAAGAAALAAMQLAHIARWRRLLAALGTPLPAPPARAIWSVCNLARYVPTA